MRFFLLLLTLMFAGLVGQAFIAPIPPYGVRVLLLPLLVFYGSLAFPLPGTLILAFCGGLMWDALHVQIALADGENTEMVLGWSVVLYGVLGALMNGFRPLFLRGRWEIHCGLCGLFTSLIVFSEYLVLTFRRDPVFFLFNHEIWWRIGGAGLIATSLSPLLFFALNYLAELVGYNLRPRRETWSHR